MLNHRSFPWLYHAHHILQLKDLSFWLDLAALQGDPILELGCGTGRVLLSLAKAGHRAYGLDNDSGMLAVLDQNLTSDLQSSVYFFQADLTAFHLGIQFALILLPCNTFSTLRASKRLSTLALVRQHLLPGGLFAASLPNPSVTRHLPQHADPEVEETFPHPVDGEPVQVSSAWERTAHHFIIHWHYDHLLPDGRVERQSAQVHHFLTSTTTYLEELNAAGMEVTHLYGDFDTSQYTSDSPYLILVAQVPPYRDHQD